MRKKEFLKSIQDIKVSGVHLQTFGFDTIAKTLDIEKKEVKKLWNLNNLGFKRITRTEFELKRRFDLELKRNSKTPLYEVKCDKYLSFRLTPTTALIIPDGLITDLGSIPKIMRFIADKDDIRFILAFLFHDVEYAQKILGRCLADDLILEISKYMGAGWLDRNLIHSGVRVGGWVSYGRTPTDQDLKNIKLIAKATKEFYKNSFEVSDVKKFNN